MFYHRQNFLQALGKTPKPIHTPFSSYYKERWAGVISTTEAKKEIMLLYKNRGILSTP